MDSDGSNATQRVAGAGPGAASGGASGTASGDGSGGASGAGLPAGNLERGGARAGARQGREAGAARDLRGGGERSVGAGVALGTAALDAAFVQEMLDAYLADPTSVEPSWRHFFEGYQLGQAVRDQQTARLREKQSAVERLIEAYRRQGHLIAQVDPLGQGPRTHPDLEVSRFGLTEEDLETVFDTGTLAGPERATLDEILGRLLDTYCRAVGVEYMHIGQPAVRAWLQAQMEPRRNTPEHPPERRRAILQALVDAHLFETFVHTHYVGQKRFSLEGGESLIPALQAVADRAPEHGVAEIVLGMSHRGRLNVLANLLRKSYATLFSEFEENFVPESVWGAGDVKYHKGYSATWQAPSGRTVRLSLTANPSHLEAVDPVVEGKARAKQRLRGDTEARRSVLPLIVHGDAGFAGQGIVAETLNLSGLPGYETGGTVHVIVNNQIGFTTPASEARSTTYASDVAKMIEAPIFHVNGDDPDAVVYVMDLALAFRQRFRRDVVVDLVCYRRHGHNESDDPGFTQPLMVARIRAHPPVLDLYAARLVRLGVISEQEAAEMRASFRSRLEQAYRQIQEGAPADPGSLPYQGRWAGFSQPYSDAPVDTGVPAERLAAIGEALTAVPEGFVLHRRLVKRAAEQREVVAARGEVDWALAEALAWGTLLVEGTPVRLSGQDCARGTFSHRHAVWFDQQTGATHTPLNHLAPNQARFCVYNSLLSEAAVLGFEYGYSLVDPQMLVIWEAQFGDFANGAQVIVDQFLASSESKWQRSSGLVLLLPHGYEGQGPEHSNAYLERYLAACAENNLQVTVPSTPAQYFHLLRRQMRRPFRRPLVVMSPKSLLRAPAARSPFEDLVSGRFQDLLPDPQAPEAPRRVVFCAGKIYYELDAHRRRHEIEDVLIVRVEQLYPFPWRWLSDLAERYAGAEEVIWAQEEPQNRGAWSFIGPRLREIWGDRPIRYVGRRPSASPATGSLRRHREEQGQIVRGVFERRWNGRERSTD